MFTGIIKTVLLLLTQLSISACNEDGMTAEQVIHRFIKVSGDENDLNKLKSTEAKGEGTVNGDTVHVTVIKIFPKKIYERMESKKFGIIETIYSNGRYLIKKDGKTIPAKDSMGVELSAVNSFPLADMAYEKLGYQMRLIPSDETNDYKVQLISPSGNKTIKYYDKDNGYLTKVIYPDNSISYFSNYITTKGFTFSRIETSVGSNNFKGQVVISQIILNPKIDSSMFNF